MDDFLLSANDPVRQARNGGCGSPMDDFLLAVEKWQFQPPNSPRPPSVLYISQLSLGTINNHLHYISEFATDDPRVHGPAIAGGLARHNQGEGPNKNGQCGMDLVVFLRLLQGKRQTTLLLELSHDGAGPPGPRTAEGLRLHRKQKREWKKQLELNGDRYAAEQEELLTATRESFSPEPNAGGMDEVGERKRRTGSTSTWVKCKLRYAKYRQTIPCGSGRPLTRWTERGACHPPEHLVKVLGRMR
ncbi:MAG: hypothetical protein Q9184_006891 [Pyrenodesmia sp. 2 TL-2023]